MQDFVIDNVLSFSIDKDIGKDKEDVTAALKPDGYSLYTDNRLNKRGGGTALLIKDHNKIKNVKANNLYQY